MWKKGIKYAFYILCIGVLIFCYLVYFGQNRFSMMLNQGLTSLPNNLEDVNIENRRGLFSILTNYDANTQSKCKVSQQDLLNWLSTTKFQVIHYQLDGDSDITWFTSFDSLPESIIKNEIGYFIQFENGDPKSISVGVVNEKKVDLSFYSDWN